MPSQMITFLYSRRSAATAFHTHLDRLHGELLMVTEQTQKLVWLDAHHPVSTTTFRRGNTKNNYTQYSRSSAETLLVAFRRFGGQTIKRSARRQTRGPWLRDENVLHESLLLVVSAHDPETCCSRLLPIGTSEKGSKRKDA